MLIITNSNTKLGCKVGFFTCGTADILARRILCMHCLSTGECLAVWLVPTYKMPVQSPLYTPQMCPDIAKCTLGAKPTPGESHSIQ